MRSKRSVPRFVIAVAALGLVTGACTSSGTQTAKDQKSTSQSSASGAEVDLPEVFTPVLVATLGEETAPVKARDGTWRVAYELVLTNARKAPARIDRISVVDAQDTSSVLATLDDKDLVGHLRPLSGGEVKTASLKPDQSVMAFIDVSFKTLEDVPEVVAHRIEGAGAGNPGATDASPMDYMAAPFAVQARSAVTLGAPLKGGRWLAVNSIDNSAGVHRRATQSISGQMYAAQRFAIDWMKLEDDGTLASGDTSKVKNWHSYGQAILAVADAEVVEVLDEMPDQAPGELPDPASMTLETVDGNHVILKLADGVYAFYAHLEKGSITVKEGDNVKVGEEIGLLGNSGNTSAPHLHLHIMTAASALAADSIPYNFDNFAYEGRINETSWNEAEDIEGPWKISGADGKTDKDYTKRLPLDLDVVTFPK